MTWLDYTASTKLGLNTVLPLSPILSLKWTLFRDLPWPFLVPHSETGAQDSQSSSCALATWFSQNAAQPERNRGSERLRTSPQGVAKWMAGVWAAPAGSGQTWSLTLLPSTQRDGHIKKCAPKSFHRLYSSTRKHKVSGKATRVTLHSGSTVQTSVLGCVTSSPGYNSGCFLRETSQDPSLWNSSPLEWHMEGHSKVKWLFPVCCSWSPVCPVLVMACLLQGR